MCVVEHANNNMNLLADCFLWALELIDPYDKGGWVDSEQVDIDSRCFTVSAFVNRTRRTGLRCHRWEVRYLSG